MFSPRLTKIGGDYKPLGSNDSPLFAFHVDYRKDRLRTLKYKDPRQFLTASTGINLQTEFDLSERFIVVHNSSKDSNASSLVPY